MKGYCWLEKPVWANLQGEMVIKMFIIGFVWERMDLVNNGFKWNVLWDSIFVFYRDEKCFVCEECGKSFQRRTSLQKHAINWHESNSAMGPFKCELCPKKFIRRIYLTNHKLRMHGLDKKFLCQVFHIGFVMHLQL